MKSTRRGRRTADIEVIRVSCEGVWLRLDGRSHLLCFEEFPWFRDATIGQITNIERPSPDELRWPDLDLDLGVDSIRHPERYPLLFDPVCPTRSRRTRRRASKR